MYLIAMRMNLINIFYTTNWISYGTTKGLFSCRSRFWKHLKPRAFDL